MSERSAAMNTLLSFFKCEREIACSRQTAAKSPVYVGEGQGAYKVVEKVVWVGEGKGSIDVDQEDQEQGSGWLSRESCRTMFYYFVFFSIVTVLLVGIAALLPAAIDVMSNSGASSASTSQRRPEKIEPAFDRKASVVATTHKKYDCEKGYNRLFGLDWTSAKKEWCCLHRDRGCPVKAASFSIIEKNARSPATSRSPDQAPNAPNNPADGLASDDQVGQKKPKFRTWARADAQMEDDLVKQILDRARDTTIPPTYA